MTDTNVIKLAQPGTFTNSLTEILRDGARALLTQAVETEVADFLGRYGDLKTEAGHQRVVRHGHLPEREIMTGIGSVAVRQPRVRDREAIGLEDVSPAAQSSSLLLIGGTRAPLTRTTRLPSADELFVGMFSVARDIDLPIAQLFDVVGIGRATLVALFLRPSSL